MDNCNLRIWIAKKFDARLLFALWIVPLLCSIIVPGCTMFVPDELETSLAQIEEEQIDARELNKEAIAAVSDLFLQRELLEKALKKDELFGEAHNNLGVVLFRQGHFHSAAKHLQRAADLLAGSPTPLVNMAILHVELDQWDRALFHARQAHERDPYHVLALQILAVSLVESGKTGKELEAVLQKLVMRASDESWRDWALKQIKASQDQH